MGEIWNKNPDAVRKDILRVAYEEFAKNGFYGARIGDIATSTKTSKRMIYYYFGSKEGLYLQVLEDAYREMREAEMALDFSGTAPDLAMRRLIEFTFDHHWTHPDFIRLVMSENIHHAEHLDRLESVWKLNKSAVSTVDKLYRRGCQEGLFKPGLSATELHWHISAQAFFNVSNRPTFEKAFGDSLFGREGQLRLRQRVVDMVMSLLLVDGRSSTEIGQTLPQEDPEPMMNPELNGFLEVWESKWQNLSADATPQERDARFEVIAKEMRLPSPDDVQTDEEHWIESREGPVRVRLFRHKEGGVQPCLIYLHGGAWMQGSPETHWDIASRMASWCRMTVISVDYAKTPDHPFPAAVNQCADVIKWAFSNADRLAIDPARISVGGDSAGGNLAAVMGLVFRGTAQRLKAQLLIYPACDFDTTRPSCKENYDGPLLQVAGMDAINAMYCPNPGDLTNPLAAPLLAHDHSGLPPAMIAVAQCDPLRDSGLAYAEALQSAGVEVLIDKGAGMIHGYMRAMEYCTASVESLQRMCGWLSGQNEKS
jgi:acetyl esterase/lipase/AcrR family transcriptional regulator